jgi:hypothetical protein
MPTLRETMKADNKSWMGTNIRSTKYSGNMGDAIPAATAARSVQIESKICPAVRHELAPNIPPVQ